MNQAPANLLLTRVPTQQKELLTHLLEPVALPLGKVLYSPDRTPTYVHFLTSGVASIFTNLAGGESSEVGMVGSEGAPEGIYLLGPGPLLTTCSMQIAGTGLRIRLVDLEHMFNQEEEIRKVLLRFVQYQGVLLSQVAACNRFHEIEHRLARWLLMVEDRTTESSFQITQESLASMLGTRRQSLTVVAGRMQRNGLIEYSRGKVHILDRAALEDLACECYPVSCSALHRLSNAAPQQRRRV